MNATIDALADKLARVTRERDELRAALIVLLAISDNPQSSIVFVAQQKNAVRDLIERTKP